MLGYRTTFAVDIAKSAGIEAESAIDTLLREGFDWLRKNKKLQGLDDLEPWVEKEFPDQSRVIYGKGKTPAGDEYAKLVFFDRPQESGQWVTTLLIGRSAKKQGLFPLVSVEIDAPEDPRSPGRPMFSNRPWLVKNILDGYVCLDRDIRTSDDPTIVSDEEGVEEFLGHLEDGKHRGLIIACGTDGTVERSAWKQILDDITTECAGQATVFLLDPVATDMFNARVSSAHVLTPYALRTFKPGAVLDDPGDGLRHRVLTARALLGKNRKELAKMFGRVSRRHSSSLPPDPFMRRLDSITGAELDRVTFERTVDEHTALLSVAREAPREVSEVRRGLLLESRSDVAPLDVRAVEETAESAKSAVSRESVPVQNREEELEMLRLEVCDLRARLGEKERSLAESGAENERLYAEAQLLEARYESAMNAHLDELQQYESDLAEVKADLEDKELEVEIQLEDKNKLEKELRSARYQLGIATRKLREKGIDSSAFFIDKPDPYEDVRFSEWEELELFGPETFTHLLLTYDKKAANELSRHGRSLSWLRETCSILAMLDEYAAFRTSEEGREFQGGLHEYLREGAPPGARLIAAARLRSTESDTTQSMWGDQRTFEVPKEVDPSGRRTMLAHIEIQHFKSVSPRLYFEDRTGDLGKVVIGYIGRHLKNTKSA